MKTIQINDTTHTAIKTVAARNQTTIPEAVECLLARAEWAALVAAQIHQIGASLPVDSAARKMALSLALTSPFAIIADDDEREAMRPPGPEAAI